MKNLVYITLFTFLVIFNSCTTENIDDVDITNIEMEGNVFQKSPLVTSFDIGEFHTNITLLAKPFVDSLSILLYNNSISHQEFLSIFFNEFLIPTMADSLNFSELVLRDFLFESYSLDSSSIYTITSIDWDKNNLLDEATIQYKDAVLQTLDNGYTPIAFSDSLSVLKNKNHGLVDSLQLRAAEAVANSSYQYWYEEFHNWNVDTLILSKGDPVEADIKGAISGFLIGLATGGIGSVGGAAAGATAATLVEAVKMVAEKICCDEKLQCCPK